jgi:hypothetical protein
MFDSRLPPYFANPTVLDLANEVRPGVSAKTEIPQLTPVMSVQSMQASMESALHVAVETFFDSATFAQLMHESIQRVTSVHHTYHSRYDNTSALLDGSAAPMASGKEDTTSGADNGYFGSKHHLSRTRIGHRPFAMGTLFGNVWVRKSKFIEGGDSNGTYYIVTSFIFYPSRWLTKMGLRHGMEANLSKTKDSGRWKFKVSPIRAVPDNSLIFDLCRTGNLQGVQLLLNRLDASIRDTNSSGWTPLHVSRARDT